MRQMRRWVNEGLTIDAVRQSVGLLEGIGAEVSTYRPLS